MLENFKKLFVKKERPVDEGVEGDRQVFEQLQPQIDNFLENLTKAESIEDVENLDFVLRNLELEFSEIKDALKKTYHGAQYFRESDEEHKDSLETSQFMAVYTGTPFENFRQIELRMNNLKTRLGVLFSETSND